MSWSTEHVDPPDAHEESSDDWQRCTRCQDVVHECSMVMLGDELFCMYPCAEEEKVELRVMVMEEAG